MIKSAYPVTDFVPADIDCSKWSELEPLFADLAARDLSTKEALERWLLDRSELSAAISEARATRYIAMTCHTDDEAKRKAFLQFVEEIDPKVKPMWFALDKRYVASPARGEMERPRYEVLDRDTENDVKLFREENVALETELEKLEQQYSELSGAQTCEFDGATRTMPQMQKYLERTDRDLREKAFLTMTERRFADHATINKLFDKMVELRHQVALNAGEANYRDFMFKKYRRFDYGPAECVSFHEACDIIIVPMQRNLNKQRKMALGVERLRPWDLNVDVKGRGPLEPFSTVAELVNGTEAIFRKMDPELGELFSKLREPGCLDLESRKGKAPGGYQYNRDRERKPFIFMNAAGLARDVDTLLHEGGHAFHSMLSADEPIVHYRWSPIEFAEVASMTMELFAFPFLTEFYSREDADRARRRHLEDLTRLLPWIACIDAYQHWIYLNPQHDQAERAEMWYCFEDQYGPMVRWDGLDEEMRETNWQKQPHLFGAPFYYIEYGIAQIGALQLWKVYRRNPGEALARYKRALRLGGSRPLPDLFDAAGLKFTFGPEIVEEVMADVKEELDRLPM